jgi:hypothetical protein
MIRLTLRIMTVLSFMVFVPFSWLWLRSYGVSDFGKHEVVRREGSTLTRQSVNIVTGDGGICFNHVGQTGNVPNGDEGGRQIESDGWDYAKITEGGYAGKYHLLAGRPSKYGFAKVTLNQTKDGISTQSSFVVFPLIVPVLVFAIFPAIGSVKLVIAFRRHRRLKALNYHEVHLKSAA